MYTLLLLPLLLLTSVVVAQPASPELCEEIRTVVEEHIEAGYINEQEAEELLGRCARRPK